ncbi:MAG: YqgE/AlgH family protein [Flavobacteriales bacterium]|nr:YqgE/AlgH family protein [Flavobacteriales bacterium]
MKIFKNFFKSDNGNERKQQDPIVKTSLTFEELSRGDVIVSKPYATHNLFEKTVILILNKNEKSISGIILNKSVGLTLKDWHSHFNSSDFPIMCGGPAQEDKIFVLNKYDTLLKSNVKISDKIYFSSNIEEVFTWLDYKKFSTKDIRIFRGVTGWRIEQFRTEMEEGAWNIFRVNGFQLSDSDNPDLWYEFYPDFQVEPDFKIYPRLKHNLNHAMYKENKITEGEFIEADERHFIYQDFLSDDLTIVFVRDVGSYYQYLNGDFFEQYPHFDVEMLLRLAIWNLEEDILDNIQLQSDPEDVIMLMAGGEFESSLILSSGVLANLHRNFGNNLIMAIPTRDLLLFCKGGNEVALVNMKNMVEHYFKNPETKGILSKGIYKIENSLIELLESAF